MLSFQRLLNKRRIKPSLTSSRVGMNCKMSSLPPLVQRKHYSIHKSISTLNPAKSFTTKRRNIDDITPIVFNLSFPFQHLRSEYVFPELEPLPSHLSANFDRLFNEKIKICSKLCDFSLPYLEIEAKNIKQSTLMEFVNIQYSKDIGTNYYMDIFNMICINIFRKLPVFPEKYRYSTEEYNVVDPSWAHIGLCYTILQRILPYIPTFDEVFLSKLASRLYTPLQEEKDQITSFLAICITEFPYTRKHVRSALLKILVDYLDLNTFAFAVSPALTLLSKHYAELKVSVDDFMLYVIPLVTAKHLRYFAGPFQSLLLQIVKKNPSSGEKIFLKLVGMWPYYSINKQAYFCRILVDLAEELDKESFNTISNRFMLILCNLCMSPNEKVAEESIIIWSHRRLLQLVEGKAYTLLPSVLGSLDITSYDHWSNTVKNSAHAAIQIIKEFSPAVFKEVANQMLAVPKDVNEHLHTSWIQIAKKAAEEDISIDIYEWIEKINAAFPPEQYKNRYRRVLI